MNQILVTQKLYVTPELRRKKKIYKLCFILSVVSIIVLFGMYTYTEYDRNKELEVADDILFNLENIKNDNTVIDQKQNALIVAMTQEQIVEENISANEILEENDKNQIISGSYKASNGKTYSIIGIINIPKINVKYPIIDQTSEELLKVSACKFWGPNANEVGNLCVVGHNYKNSKFFSKVPTLSCGDIVEITDLNGKTIQYEAYDIYTVDPSDTKCTSQLTQGRREVTVITCTNDVKQRVVVKCREKVN